jgi:N-acyl homoserine lactone hydrolase
MKLHMLQAGRIRMRKSIFLRAEKTEMIELPVSCALIRHPKGNVLFDTGCHPSVAADPQARWGDLVKMMTPIMPSGENVLSSLEAIGIEPEDIDVVVCSHLHPDHCGCNQFFPQGALLRQCARNGSGEGGRGDQRRLSIGGLGPRVAYDRDRWGARSIRRRRHRARAAARAHAGHDGSAGPTGQKRQFSSRVGAVSLLENLAQNSAPRNTWNVDLYLESFAKIRQLHAAGTTVICGHDDAQWRSLRKGLDAYE